MKPKPPTLRQFQSRFPTEEACLEHLMRQRYGARHVCAGCAREAVYYRIKARRAYSCEWCGHQVYPTAGTPFERTRTPLRDWYFVMFQFCASRNGVAAKEVERQLGVTYKTAWRMCHHIREFMGSLSNPGPLGGTGAPVQIDETLIGGRLARGRRGGDPAEGKVIVFGMLEPGGRIATKIVADRRHATLYPLIREGIEPGSKVHTDDYRSYMALGAMPGMDLTHHSVNHRSGEYVNYETGATVNAIEGVWSALKRGIAGTHIHVSSKHLPKYLGEFEYRWNMRQQPDQMLPRLLTSFPRPAAPSRQAGDRSGR